MTSLASDSSRFAPLPGLAAIGRDALYLLLGLPLGIAFFTFVVTGFSLAAGLLITLIGVPVLLLTLLASRWIARFERARARLVVDAPAHAAAPPGSKLPGLAPGPPLGSKLPGLAPGPPLGSKLPGLAPGRPLEGGVVERSKTLLRDRSAWTGAAWSLLLLPIGTAGFTVAVTLWSTAVGFATSPLWYWALPQDNDTIPPLDSQSAGYAALRVLIGIAMLPSTAVVCRALAAGTGRLARAVLR